MVRAHIFQECFENTAGLLIDETRDTLHTPTTSEAANCLRGWFAESSRETGKNSNKRTGFVIPWIFSRKIMRWRFTPALRSKRKKNTIVGNTLVCETARRTFQDLSRPFRVQTWCRTRGVLLDRRKAWLDLILSFRVVKTKLIEVAWHHVAL